MDKGKAVAGRGGRGRTWMAGLAFACLCGGGAVAQVQPNSEGLSPSDWAVLERSSFGATREDAKKMASMGRSAWIEDQLRLVGDECLPARVQERVAALGYQSYDPMATVRRERSEAREARERGGKEEERMVAQKYRRAPVEDAFERRSLRALYCSAQLQERMVDFWFNHFNVYARKGQVAALLPDYEERAIRPHVFGKFEEMAFATLTHPAMLQYLDNVQNVRGKLNENYARELMELHTMGAEGGYAQKDVQELARILTGVGQQPADDRRVAGGPGALALPNGFAFDPRRHDEGQKVFLGRVYPAGGGFDEVRQAVRQLASHPSTARFLSLRMAQYFVADEPPKSLVEDMSSAYMKSGGSLAAMAGVMARSAPFAEPRLSKFKDPQAWVYSAMRAQYGADVALNVRPLQKWMSDLGQPTYMKPTPDGYANGAAEWASADQLGKRFDIARQLVGAAGALFSPRDGGPGAEPGEARAAAGRGHPVDPSALWGLSWRYSSPGLAEALREARGDREARALVLASPEFMRR